MDNVGPDVSLSWAFQPDLTLEGDESGGEPFSSLSAGAIAAGDRGHLFVADPAASVVQAFDSVGRMVTSFGGVGRGPADFDMPVALAVDHTHDQVVVYDITQRRTSIWTISGEALGTEPTPGTNLSGIAFVGGELVQGVRYRDEPGDRRDELIVQVGDEDVVLHERTSPPAPIVDLSSCGIRIPGASPVFARNSFAWDADADRIVLADGEEYEVQLLTNRELKAIYRRQVEALPTTRDMAIARIREGVTVQRYDCDPGEIVDSVGVNDRIPLLNSVAIDPSGSIWVGRAVSDSSQVIDVLDEEGVYRGTLPEGFPMPAAFLTDGRVAVIRTDDLGVDRLQVGRIVDR